VSTALATRAVGSTKLRITELGFGTAPLGNLYRTISDSDARDTIIAALEAGIGYFDTAPYYGFGLSERRLGDVLRGADDFILSTKVGRLLQADASVRAYAERFSWRASADEFVRNLQPYPEPEKTRFWRRLRRLARLRRRPAQV